jgi:virginiamycin B lyase
MREIRWLAYLMTMAVGMAAIATNHAAAAPAGPERASGVTEYTVEAKRIFHLVQASDGTIVYGSSAGTWDHPEPRLGRVGPTGPLGETAGPNLWIGEIAIGTEGDTWAATVDDSGESWIGHSPSGAAWSEIAGTAGARALAPRAAGGMWFLQMEPRSNRTIDDVPKVGFVTSAGEVTAFPLPNHEAGLSSIAEGHEGDAWFTEYLANKIGRMTPAGELTEFPLRSGSGPDGITVDAQGNIWFTEPAGNGIGRITPSGKITEYRLPQAVRPAQIAAGADGRLWFTEWMSLDESRSGTLGRITPSGRFTRVELPNRESEPIDVIAGAEGNIWYSAMGEPGCIGGSSCITWEPSNPAIIGRVEPTPLTTAVAARHATLLRNRIDVAIACRDGNVNQICKGSIAIKLNGRQVAKSRYRVPVDTSLEVPVRRLGGISSLLKSTRGNQRAVVLLHPDEGKVRRHVVTLTRHQH